jgi:hypothetical protein
MSQHQNGPAILLCSKCRHLMTFVALLQTISDLPLEYVYKCVGCRRIDTIRLDFSHG